VNEDQNNTIHSTGAVLFFAGYLIFSWVIYFRVLGVSQQDPDSIQPISLLVKIATCIGATIALVTMLINITLGFSSHFQTIAICEWLGTGFLLLFVMSTGYEFGNDVDIAGVLVSSASAKALLPA